MRLALQNCCHLFSIVILKQIRKSLFVYLGFQPVLRVNLRVSGICSRHQLASTAFHQHMLFDDKCLKKLFQNFTPSVCAILYNCRNWIFCYYKIICLNNILTSAIVLKESRLPTMTTGSIYPAWKRYLLSKKGLIKTSPLLGPVCVNIRVICVLRPLASAQYKPIKSVPFRNCVWWCRMKTTFFIDGTYSAGTRPKTSDEEHTWTTASGKIQRTHQNIFGTNNINGMYRQG